MEEYKGEDEVIIANQDIRLYLGQCAISFQKFDQLVLSAGESFVEKQRNIANILAAVGIEVQKDYLNTNGKFKLVTEEFEELNDKTGKREIRICHKLGITKIPNLFMYTDLDSAIEVPPVNDKIIPLETHNTRNNNEIIIADRDIRLYLGQCLVDFQRFDSLILSSLDGYVEKQRYIAKILAGVGIVIDKPYKAERGKIKDVTEEIEIRNERTGRREIKTSHKLGITKIEDLCMYNKSNPIVEVSQVEETKDKANTKTKGKYK